MIIRSVLIAILCGGALCLQAGAVERARGGRTVVIVAPSRPSKVEQFAARELSRCLKASLGWSPRIVEGERSAGAGPTFWVGNLDVDPAKTPGFPVAQIKNTPAPLGEDGVYLNGDGTNVILVGKGKRGALNAVYTFLEDYVGCRWPEPGVEYVPKLTELKLRGIDVVSNPAFVYRGIGVHGVCGPETFVGMIDWMAKNRMNWFQLFPKHYDDLRPSALAEIEKRGLSPNIGGHSREFFFPHTKYFKDNPDYFALVNGKRVEAGQICYSNFDSISEYAKNVVDYLKTRPEIDMVGLWPSDGYGFCECAKCKSRPMTDVLLRYINELTQRINAAFPKVKTEFLSYIDYVTPPKEDRPLANVVPTYCEYGTRNQYHPITDDRMDNKLHRANLEKWIADSKDVTVFSYYGDDCMKRYNYNDISATVFADFRYYKKIGLKGHFVLMTNPESWWSNAPHLYAAAKALWNPSLDVGSVQREFYKSDYGPAAEAMLAHAQACREYFALMLPYGQDVERTLWLYTIDNYDRSKDAAAISKIDAAVAEMKKYLGKAREANPPQHALLNIRKLESDAEYDGLCVKTVIATYRADAEKTVEARKHAFDLMEAALKLEVMAEDDLKYGYTNARRQLVALGFRAAGLNFTDMDWHNPKDIDALRDYVTKGGVWRWMSADIIPSSKENPRQVNIEVTDRVKSAGRYSINWNYISGADAVEIVSSGLCASTSKEEKPGDLSELAVDTHAGHTGASNAANVYHVEIKDYDPKLRYFITGRVYAERAYGTHGQVLFEKVD